jgi:cobalamin synthase
MHLLLPLASLLGIELEELLERIRKHAVAWVAILLFAMIGLVYLLVALHAALIREFGPLWAPLIIAGAALFIALAIYGWMRVSAARARKRETQRRHSSERTALVTTAAVTAVPLLLKSPLLRTIGIPIGGALAAFYLLSRKTSARAKGRDPDQYPSE